MGALGSRAGDRCRVWLGLVLGKVAYRKTPAEVRRFLGSWLVAEAAEPVLSPIAEEGAACPSPADKAGHCTQTQKAWASLVFSH